MLSFSSSVCLMNPISFSLALCTSLNGAKRTTLQSYQAAQPQNQTCVLVFISSLLKLHLLFIFNLFTIHLCLYFLHTRLFLHMLNTALVSECVLPTSAEALDIAPASHVSHSLELCPPSGRCWASGSTEPI